MEPVELLGVVIDGAFCFKVASLAGWVKKLRISEVAFEVTGMDLFSLLLFKAGCISENIH